MRINPFWVPAIILIALFGTVLTAQATGRWTTSGRVAIDPSQMTPADLKGWMTLQEVMNGLSISQADLYAAGKVPSDVPPETALNKLEALVPGFSVTTLRDTLTVQLSGGSSPVSAASASPTSQPSSPVTPTPLAVVTPTPASTATHSGDGTGTGPTPLPVGLVLPASQIKGSMSLRSVSTQCDVPLAQILAGLNLPAETSPEALIKDLVGQGKISEVSVVQQVVAGLQSK